MNVALLSREKRESAVFSARCVPEGCVLRSRRARKSRSDRRQPPSVLFSLEIPFASSTDFRIGKQFVEYPF